MRKLKIRRVSRLTPFYTASNWQMVDLNSRSLIPPRRFLNITLWSPSLWWIECLSLPCTEFCSLGRHRTTLIPCQMTTIHTLEKTPALPCPSLLQVKNTSYFYHFSCDLFQVMSPCSRRLTKCTPVYSLIVWNWRQDLQTGLIRAQHQADC